VAEDVRPVLTRLAAEVGLSTVHVARFDGHDKAPDADAYDAWVASGMHADMSYLARGSDVRRNPALRLDDTRSVAVFSLRHAHQRPADPGGSTGHVARYAWGRDYHNLFGKRLVRLMKRLRAEGIGCWGGVDTAPILERKWARLAGAGFTGKNCLTIVPANTSWMFLGTVFLNAHATPDPPLVRDHCGTCTRCLVACPTDAFTGPYTLDARRCISYWTIEARGLAPRPLRPGFGRWLFGCDVCQEVCPHNTRPPPPDSDDLLPRNAWLDCVTLLNSPDDALIERFTGTPLRRPGGTGLKRNALIVLGNLGDDGVVDTVREQLVHSSEVVRAAAVWCLQQLGDSRVQQHVDTSDVVNQELRFTDHG
jgi:epoxyqueuosine reductase